MSAFVCRAPLLNYIIMAAVEWALVSEPDASLFVQLLHEENSRSVDHLYRETNERKTFAFARVQRPVEAFRLLVAVACLTYQSCEHPGWEDSNARKFLDDLRDLAISKLPAKWQEVYVDREGFPRERYKDAPEYEVIGWTDDEFGDAPDYRPDLGAARPWVCQCGNGFALEPELRTHQEKTRHLPAFAPRVRS